MFTSSHLVGRNINYSIVVVTISFVQTGEIQLKRNKALAKLSTVGKNYFVAFELLVTKHPTPDDHWHSVIHLSKGGNNKEYGDRVPGVWVNSDHRLHITSAVNGESNYQYNYVQSLLEGTWTRVEIQQINEEETGVTMFTQFDVTLRFSTTTRYKSMRISLQK